MEQQLGAARQRAEAQKQLAAEQKALTLAQAEEEAAQKAQQQAEGGQSGRKPSPTAWRWHGKNCPGMPSWNGPCWRQRNAAAL